MNELEIQKIAKKLADQVRAKKIFDSGDGAVLIQLPLGEIGSGICSKPSEPTYTGLVTDGAYSYKGLPSAKIDQLYVDGLQKLLSDQLTELQYLKEEVQYWRTLHNEYLTNGNKSDKSSEDIAIPS